MEKKVDSKPKAAPVEIFNIDLEASRYYPTSSSKIGSGIPTWRRPKSSGGNQRFSSFKKA